VRQSTIKKTICKSGWTKAIQPPVTLHERSQDSADGSLRGDGFALRV
jgi:hypothetical protein